MQEYYVLYGVDSSDDYLKLLSSGEFETVKEALEKFKGSEDVFYEAVDYNKLKHFKNNIIYLAKELIEKGEVQVVGSNVIVVGEDDVDFKEQAEEVIKNIVQNAEFIKKLTVEFKYRFQVLDTEIYLFKLAIVE